MTIAFSLFVVLASTPPPVSASPSEPAASPGATVVAANPTVDALPLGPPWGSPEAFARYQRRKRGFAAGMGISSVAFLAGTALIVGNLVVDTDYIGPMVAGIVLLPVSLVHLTAFGVLYVHNERHAPPAEVHLRAGGIAVRF